ncbi:DUF2934 domain-containing protein [Paracoccus benzoatiresistens]|uniref:DUF2934 domain-containing protein n=1 Tax=Paracoccus benzoatiresistens TaxID=2997341 RepID=A0ABT4J275_9RHOB|nr:DUF2934 domain-containing protein [Paracoccus sp. EF6]MCZ0961207.1 DUF2934 domain-containing protein [Paracoccus sp. EF6]
MDQDHQERIRLRAHEIWESEGRPEGRDADHWSRAEEELRNQLEGDQPSGADMLAGDTAQPQPAQTKKPAARRTRKAKADPTPYLNDGP